MKTGLRRTLSVVAVGLILGGTLTACGTASDDVEPTVTRVDVAGAPPTRTATVPDGASPEPASPVATPADPGGGQEPGGGATTEIIVDMVDLAFEPTSLSIAANTDVTVSLTNSGALEHNFSIIDQDVDSGTIPGGGTGEVIVNLPPGTFEYHCDIPGHTEAGMIGTLTVT